jgi:hypothetical protein
MQRNLQVELAVIHAAKLTRGLVELAVIHAAKLTDTISNATHATKFCTETSPKRGDF